VRSAASHATASRPSAPAIAGTRTTDMRAMFGGRPITTSRPVKPAWRSCLATDSARSISVEPAATRISTPRSGASGPVRT